MQLSQVPTRFAKPFGANAAPGFIRVVPVDSQIGIQDGAASLTDGFVPDNFLPVGAGGVPPFGQDMNGILNQATAWNQWQATGAPAPYDATFSTAVTGYPKNSVISSAFYVGYFYISLTDNNVTDPDASGAGWQLYSPFALTTGAWSWRPTQETLPGWVKGNATTVGNTGSGATQLATAEAWPIFSWFWTNFSNTLCPVSTGRGLTAAADFAAGKTIGTLDMRGTSIVGMDTMGGAPTTRLASVPVTSGSATQAGSVLGENLHALVLAENGPHGHSYVDPTHFHTTNVGVGGAVSTNNGGTNAGPINTSNLVNSSSSAVNITITSSGSGTGHNTVSLSMTGTHYFKI